MKLTTLQNGNILIEFNKTEIESIKNWKQLPLIESYEQHNPFKCLRKNTIEFVKDLHKRYGNNEFDVKSQYVVEMRRKHYITDFDKTLNTLVKRNKCNIRWNEREGKRRKMQSIQFNF